MINFLKGIIAGIGGVSPGLSGSVLLILLGLYHQTLEALGTLLTRFKQNIRFLKVSKKNHNPNYTLDAVEYKDDFFFEYRKAMKRNIYKTTEEKHTFRDKFDWDRMTQQDEDIWKIIFETLDK